MSYLRASARCFTALAVFVLIATPASAGSEDLAGLVLTLETNKDTYLWGEPIVLTITAANASSKTLHLPYGIPSWGYEAWKVTIQAEDGTLAYYVGGIALGPPIDRLPGIELKPGERIRKVEHLGYRYIFLKPDTYTMQATYAFTDPMPEIRQFPLWQGEVKSNRLILSIEEPEGEDKAAFDYLMGAAGQFHPKDPVRGALGRIYGGLCHVTNDLHEKFPSSLYTAYALCAKHRIDLSKPMPENPKPPEEVLRIFEETRLNPPNEYFRSVQPKEREELLKDLWLIVKHHPEFAFIDRVYEVMGFAHLSEGNHVQAQRMFEKAAGATKDAKRKERMGAFVEAMKGRADKPERGAERSKALEG